ncbi:unnamed protein product [Sphagnum balticum]
MAVRIINRSNELINSSVASLERALCGGSFLRDVSRENEFNACLQETLEHELDFYHPVHGEDLESELKVLSDFFRFMPNDAGGIMSHINTLMEQEHGRLVHDWKHVDGYTHQMEQLIGNLQRFRILCKDFRIQDREYDCLTSNFLVEKPRGLRMDEHPFFMTARMMRKLRICGGNYSVIELRDKYELLENFLLHDGGQFDDTFKLGSTVVQVKSLENPSMVSGTNVTIKTVTIEVDSGNLGSYETVVSVGSHIHVNLSTPVLTNIDEIKLVGRVLSCLKHMSNYKDDEAQFGVIDHLYKVGCDNFIVAKSPTIREILQMKPPNDVVLVDLSKLSDVPLIFGTDISTIHEICRL